MEALTITTGGTTPLRRRPTAFAGFEDGSRDAGAGGRAVEVPASKRTRPSERGGRMWGRERSGARSLGAIGAAKRARHGESGTCRPLRRFIRAMNRVKPSAGGGP